jgi:hypothetical protein
MRLANVHIAIAFVQSLTLVAWKMDNNDVELVTAMAEKH